MNRLTHKIAIPLIVFSLSGYFDENLTENPLHAWPSLEAVPKETVLVALAQATAD